MPVKTTFSGVWQATKACQHQEKGLTANSLQRKTGKLLKPQNKKSPTTK
jgi:hypothetical protein